MTERERIREDVPRVARTNATSAATPATYESTDVTVATPTDLVRWGSVLAGLFAALATLATLGVLGLAIGLRAFDAGDPARSFGIGAGIWGAVSALVAFFVGGLLAGRTAAFRGSNSGILNGAMVWFVAIPLLLWGIAGGIGSLASTAGAVAGTAAEVAAPVAGQAAEGAANNPDAAAPAAGAIQDAAGNLQATATAVVGGIDAQDVENAADTAGNAAWGTLLSLGLAAAAAIGGGYAGSQRATRRADVTA